MFGDPRFARASYALFAVAVLAALIKIGGMSGAEPVLLQNAPTEPAVARTGTPLEKDVPTRRLIDLPEPGDDEAGPAPAERAQKRLGASFGEPDDPSGGPSLFRRPGSGGAPPEPVCGNLGGFPQSSRVVFPLPREFFDSYEPGWGSPRPQGGHEGTDLMGPPGTPEFAITDGTVVEVAGANENGWNRLGGYTVMIRAAYDIGPIRKGDLFYYAHLDSESALPVGSRVRAGQRVGAVGDTGEGPEVTRGRFPSHLHLGWYDADEAGDRSRVESGAMDPYPLLLWLERNGGAVSGGTDASYCEAPQGPVPNTDKPGERPDMDTGDDNDASPSAGNGNKHRVGKPPNRDEEPQKADDENGGPDAAGSLPDEQAPDEETTDTAPSPPGEVDGGDGGGPVGDGETPGAPSDPPSPEQTTPVPCDAPDASRDTNDCGEADENASGNGRGNGQDQGEREDRKKGDRDALAKDPDDGTRREAGSEAGPEQPEKGDEPPA